MDNVMIDLETLGTAPGSVILSLGAVEFDETGLGCEFYVEIDQLSCRLRGLTTNVDTVAWWSEQGGEARDLLRRTSSGNGGDSLETALRRFSAWFPRGAAVWGNGAAFDNVLLSTACDACDVQAPWPFHNDRCHRTLKNLFLHVEPPPFVGVKHNALDDARHQARHASLLLRRLAVLDPADAAAPA